MTSAPNLTHEIALWSAFSHIAGLDEAGRGALAGPVCVGAAVLPADPARNFPTLAAVRDSKQLTPRQRNLLAPLIQSVALSSAVGFSSAEEIDSLGIVPATRLAALRALAELSLLPAYLLTDFRLELPELNLNQTALVKGDQRSLSIACASILAKTARDALMLGLDGQYPQYGFGRHKGYGTLTHRHAILRVGFSPVHRRTFKVKV